MIILGIDPGFATIGWGLVQKNDGVLSVLEYGHITTSKNRSFEDRLWEIYKDLGQIIEKYQPDEAAVEELFFYNNQKTGIQVAQARGVILLTLMKYRVTVAGYTPLEVKQALTNYGAADKRQVQEMVKILLHLQSIPKPDDTADALALALCHDARRRLESIKKA